jgi:ATP-dependent DNA helicase RecQ
LERTEGESDPRLFEELRRLRRQIADERNVAAFVVFSDAVLHELAARRPGSLAAFRSISGIGDNKAMQFGRRFVDCITAWCSANDIPLDASAGGSVTELPPEPISNHVEKRAYDMFKRGDSIDSVVVTLKRARSTVVEYLTNLIEREGIDSPSRWVDKATVASIKDAVDVVGAERLRPIFDHLGGAINYESIRIVLACMRNATMRENATVEH